MTAKRDLKKLVRERKSRTGERYTTARKTVLARRSGDRVPVVELEDLTADGARLGFRCTISIFPDLAKRIDRSTLLERIRDALLATRDDPAMQPLRSAMLEGVLPKVVRQPSIEGLEEVRRFVTRARAGIGGVSRSGSLLAIQVMGHRRLEMVLCQLGVLPIPTWSRRGPSVTLSAPGTVLETYGLVLPKTVP